MAAEKRGGRRLGLWGVVLVVLVLVVILQPYVIVDETTQVVITQLGEPVRELREAGLYFKLPAPIQSAVVFDRRLLQYDAEPTVVITQDKKTLVVDNYARWRIIEPTLFLQTVKNIPGAQARLDDIIYSEMRVELGKFDLSSIVSEGRNTLMEAVTRATDQKARQYGIEIVDVRIKRADLPPENEQAVFDRMRTEREREARRYRSEGEERARAVRAAADREREVILAEAYRRAQVIMGEGDAEAVRIYAAALKEDPEFYAFVRSLDAYKATLKDQTTLVIGTNSQFLKYLNQMTAEGAGASGASR